MKYCIDSNILISAYKTNYPPTTFVTLWKEIKNRIILGDIIIVDSVYKEIENGDDDLAIWLQTTMNNSVIEKPDSNVMTSYKTVVQKAQSLNYDESALRVFCNDNYADAMIIAHSLSNSYVVVTEETKQPESKRKVKIPDICGHLGVKTIKTIQMFSELGFRF